MCVLIRFITQTSVKWLELPDHPWRKQEETLLKFHPHILFLVVLNTYFWYKSPTGWQEPEALVENFNKMFHPSSSSFPLPLLYHFQPLPPLLCTLSHLAFFPRASLSVSESADAMEKRGEVNSLSPCLINNVTQRLTEWVWMAAAGIKWLEYFLHHQPPPSPSTPRLDLFNLGDKYLSDLAAVFPPCLLLFWGVFLLLPLVTAGVLAEQGSVFLSKSHVIALPSTCVLV